MRAHRLLLAVFIGTGLTAACAALGVGCTRGGSQKTSATGLEQLEQDTGVAWVAVSNNAFGTISYLAPKAAPTATLTPGADPSAAALAFLISYGAIFQMSDPSQELTPEGAGSSDGLAFASFTQREGAASVYGARLTVVFDRSGRIAFVSGLYVPNVYGISTSPVLSADEAAGKARADMARLYPASLLVSLEATPAPELTLYALGTSPTLAYSMLVSYAVDGATDTTARDRITMLYVVDASTGVILRATSGLETQYAGDAAAVIAAGNGQIGALPRTFPALGTDGDGGQVTAPYYMQVRAGQFLGTPTAPRFVRTPNTLHPAVLQSPTATSWDTSSAGGDPGSAVDAYYYLGEVDAWWQARGRNGYDNLGNATGEAGELGILVHDDFYRDGRECRNNAYWDHQGTIHVCQSDPSGLPLYAKYAPSADLVVMAHEFQHAVTQSTLGLDYSDETGALNESLSDVFGELIAHDTPDGVADCIIGDVFDPAVPDLKPVAGLRNMIDPHRSASPTTGQPDNMRDALYSSSSNGSVLVHANSGVPNKAWSLMTLGGEDHTAPFIKVAPSIALGWRDVETLYVSLIQARALDPVASFADMAYVLTGLASGQFGRGSDQETAVACAWYAVGVLSASDMSSNVGIEPCACNGKPDAGACDAGTDAAADAARGGETIRCYSTLQGTPFECDTYHELASTLTPESYCALYSGSSESATAVGSCPSPGSFIGCCNSTSDDGVWSQQCYYDLDAGASLFAGFCTAGGGTWSLSTPPSDAGSAPDGGRDSGSDGGSDSSIAPHC